MAGGLAGLRARRRAQSTDYWPGFVDAMATLLLVIIFLLSIFMIVQFVLRETITGQENKLDELGQQLAQLSNVLAMEQVRAETAEASLADTTAEANRLANVVAVLSGQRDDLTARVASFEAQVASLLADRDALRTALATSEAEATDLSDRLTASAAQIALLEDENRREISEKEAAQIALAQARDEIDEQTEAARLAAARREAMEALIAQLEADNRSGEAAISELEASRAANLALIAALESERDALSVDKETLQAALARLDGDAEALAAANKALEEERAALTAEGVERLRQLAALEQSLTAEEQQKLVEAAAAKALRERLAAADAELTAMTLALEKQRAEAEETLILLAAAEAARDDLRADLSDEAANLTREQALLATARAALAEREVKVSEQAKTLALLNQQAAALRSQLAALSAQLEASEAAEAAQNVQLANLGQRLNAALARELSLKAKEAARLEAERNDLEAYRSEFFGEMRKALGDRRDIRIVGDRFVFQSEVLFGPGSAELGFDGRGELASLGDAIRDVVTRIPAEIDWILVVEGHTDNLPLSGAGRFRDNWELSQARALSVVRYLTEIQGLPAERLAALGYGEYQPLDTGSSADARARNRRIEVKFTERPPRGSVPAE